MDYFTFQITFNSPGHDKAEHIEFKDIEEWRAVKEFQKNIWTSGFRRQLSPISWELVSPFRITSVMVLKQPHKFAI
jgi:hypothetical protein